MRNLSVRWDQTIPKQVRRTASRWSAPRLGWAVPRNHYEVLSPTPFICRAVQKCEGPRNAFFQAWRNLSVRCVITSDKPDAGVPLHGHTQINMHSADAQGKGDISILPGRGHFYFALTGYICLLTPPETGYN